MGFSLAAAFTIIGVTIFISFEIFTGSLIPTFTNVDDSYKKMVDRTIDQIQSDINITYLNYSILAGGSHAIYFWVRNTGSVNLNTSDFTIMVNGKAYPFTSYDPNIYPEKNTSFYVTGLPGIAAGARILKVTTGNGISDYYTYYII